MQRSKSFKLLASRCFLMPGCWVQDLDAVPHASATFTSVDGDGTVPAESATAHGLQETATAAVKGAHRDLVNMQVSGRWGGHLRELGLMGAARM